MVSRIETAAARLASRLKSRTGQTVQYVRGGQSLTLTVTKGQTTWERINRVGVLERVDSADWLIDAADLDFGAGPVEPARGDTIRETAGGTVYVYEVLPFGENKDMWRYSDRHYIKLRIHTKLIDTEAA